MSELIQKVIAAENFYTDQFISFDYKLADYNFATLKSYFKGEVALELGPASGFMTKELVKEFKVLHIVEGSKTLLDQIPNYENVTKHNSFFEEYSTDIKFDTIIMSHVLEHISDAIQVLKRVKSWLAPSGVLLVSVPNAKSIHRLVAVEMGMLSEIHELNQRDKDLGHYRVYDMEMLKSDLVAAGFRIKESGGIFFKPLSNGQINDQWTKEMMDGFFKVGKHFPENCAEIFVVCEI